MSCIERSLAVYHDAGAAVAGTAITVPDPDSLGNIWSTLTVINDTDQDIKIKYKSATGYNGEFIVPKVAIGFTKALKGGAKFDNSTLVAYSLAVGAASGKITFNFGV